ncbi:hypothetical protein APF79_07780 [bacterium BRH_c32]|nr:MAG: hypothetical protein APF79_07780 [bacterium BRH_c32]
MIKKFRFIAFFIFSFGYISACSTEIIKKEPAPFIINIDTTKISSKNFRGLGFEWDARNYTNMNIVDNDYKLIFDRAKWMNFKIIRTMMQVKWAFDDDDNFIINSDEFYHLTKILDYCEQNEISVIMQEWGIEPEWLNHNKLNKVDESKYLDMIIEYMDYFVNKKKYRCIKYFGFVNEPNYEVVDYARWKRGFEYLHSGFEKKGVIPKIKFMAPGQSNNDDWFQKSVNDLSPQIGLFDVHIYEWKKDLLLGGIYYKTKDFLSVIEQKSENKEKLFFISEAGMRDGQNAEINKNIDSFDYAQFMADYGCQALNAGANSVLAWMLDDNSHPDFQWGAWKNKQKQFSLRPWFYTWGLFSKLFPQGSNIIKINLTSIDLRATAALYKDEYSICVVNNSASENYFYLKGDVLNQKLYYITQTEDSINESISDIEKKVLTISPSNQEIKIYLPGKSHIFLTTMRIK